MPMGENADRAAPLLQHRHRAELRVDGTLSLRLLYVVLLQRPHERRQDLAAQVCIAGQDVAKVGGDGDHELPHRHLADHAVTQVDRQFRHPLAIARRTDTP